MLLAAEEIYYHSCRVSANDVNCAVTLPTFFIPFYALLTGSFRQRMTLLHRPLVQEHATNKNEKSNESGPEPKSSHFMYTFIHLNGIPLHVFLFINGLKMTNIECRNMLLYKKVKQSYYSPGQAQRVPGG
jgi:hypothetical protein